MRLSTQKLCALESTPHPACRSSVVIVVLGGVVTSAVLSVRSPAGTSDVDTKWCLPCSKLGNSADYGTPRVHRDLTLHTSCADGGCVWVAACCCCCCSRNKRCCRFRSATAWTA